MRDAIVRRVPHVHEQPESQALDYYQCQYKGEQSAHQVKQNPGPGIFRVIKVFQRISKDPEDDTDKRIRNEGGNNPGKTLRPHHYPEEMEQPNREKRSNYRDDKKRAPCHNPEPSPVVLERENCNESKKVYDYIAHQVGIQLGMRILFRRYVCSLQSSPVFKIKYESLISWGRR